MNRHIFLIGFMGAGKSTVAALLAERLSMPLVDVDAVVESTQGKTVAQIFTEQGESAFRDAERAALLGLEGLPPSVVACGGGIVTRDENRADLRRLGTVVYLQVSAAEAVARVGDASTRPLLSGPSGTLAATSLLQAREALYRAAADLVVDTEGCDAKEVADRVLAAIRQEI